MKERPILFSGPMVRAILEGRKTQTRRIVNHEGGLVVRNGSCIQLTDSGLQWIPFAGSGTVPCPAEIVHKYCPHGRPGDRLWLREAWRPWSWHEGSALQFEYKADGSHAEENEHAQWSSDYEEWFERIHLSITKECDDAVERGDATFEHDEYRYTESPIKWRPSIHMPRWASRITLELTDVRVERLNDISEEDARAEGIEIVIQDGIERFREYTTGETTSCPIDSFASLWESINGPDSWESNPFVWVESFKVIA